MGNDNIISPSQHSSKKYAANFKNMDPTIILKLHSIISGLDVFELKQKYDYKINEISNNLISMNVPADMLNELQTLARQKLDYVLAEWKKSQEVDLCCWSESQAEAYLFALIRLSKKNSTNVNIAMTPCEKPTICA